MNSKVMQMILMSEVEDEIRKYPVAYLDSIIQGMMEKGKTDDEIHDFVRITIHQQRRRAVMTQKSGN